GKEWWGFIGFDETRYERDWSKAEIDALKISAGLVAAVIARTRADARIRELDRERAERQAARAEERRSRFLAAAGRVFAARLEPGEILERLARLVVPELADWSIVDVVEADFLRRAAVAHGDPAAAPLAAVVQRSAPPRDETNPILRTGQDGPAHIRKRSDADAPADLAAIAGARRLEHRRRRGGRFPAPRRRRSRRSGCSAAGGGGASVGATTRRDEPDRPNSPGRVGAHPTTCQRRRARGSGRRGEGWARPRNGRCRSGCDRTAFRDDHPPARARPRRRRAHAAREAIPVVPAR